MDYYEHFKQQEIWFDVSDTETELIDNVAFIHLVIMKFDGNIIKSNKYDSDENKIYTIKIKFPTWDACSNAKAHCDRNLDNNGNVVSDYKGALDSADPARKMAENMLKKINNNQYAQ